MYMLGGCTQLFPYVSVWVFLNLVFKPDTQTATIDYHREIINKQIVNTCNMKY